MVDAPTIALASLVVANLLAWIRNSKVMDLRFVTLREHMDLKFKMVNFRLEKLEKLEETD